VLAWKERNERLSVSSLPVAIATADRPPALYPAAVTAEDDPIGRQLRELRRMLELQLEREARPFTGCWPLAVALLGLALAVALLFEVV